VLSLPRLLVLAAAMVACASFGTAAAAPEDRTLARPIEVRAKLVSGATFSGQLRRWGEDGIEGSFGRHAWLDLVGPDIRRLYVQVMDKDDASQWLRLGELLASSSGGERFAAEAFGQARRRGTAEADIEAARTRARGAAAAREERERMERERRLQDAVLPDDATAAPWPVLSDAQRADAVQSMKDEAVAALGSVGISCEPVETERFLLYGDLPRAELERWGRDLDAMYARVADLLAVPKGVNLFWGKAVILAFQRQDTFQVVEAAAFRHKAPASLRGVCHQRGPQAFISIWRGNDELEFASTLVHETTHGVVHRYATAARLPEWANEGFAEWVARACVPRSRVDANRRPQGLAFFRAGGDATKVMAMDGKAGTWPGDNAIGYAVGYLLVDLMIAERPKQFAAWVKAVKGGKDWSAALAEEFGMTPGALAQAASSWFRTNDGPPRR
jgi:hypothetical protein